VNILIEADRLLVPDLTNTVKIVGEFGTRIQGNYRNLLIKQHTNYVSISGSIQKLIRTNECSFEKTKEGIEFLCDRFSFEPKEAKLNRFDFQKTFTTINEPKDYYTFLGNHKRFFRSTYKNSLYYTNSTRVLNFYNKAKEMQVSGNLFRYEMRYQRPELILKKKIYLDELMNEAFYSSLLTNWKQGYQQIEKLRQLIPMENLKTPTQFFEYLEAKAISDIGLTEIEKQIKVAQKTNTLTKQNAKRIRDKIRDLQKQDFYKDNDLINELDNKILNA
jgi:hypothetical protein